MSELFDYGIHNEASNIRAHVAPLACCVFVFPTICGVRALEGTETRPAFQPSVSYPTAWGHIVPPSKIKDLKHIRINQEHFVDFTEDLSTHLKGEKAVCIIQKMLRGGVFPLWIDGEFLQDIEMQVTGTDIAVRGKWKIEVKCDYRASMERGKPHPKCTGNLYLQTAECNPYGYK